MLNGHLSRLILFIVLIGFSTGHSASANPCNTILKGSSSTAPKSFSSRDIRWNELQPPVLLEQIRIEYERFKTIFSKIVHSEQKPTFKNTILAVDFALSDLNTAFYINQWLKMGLSSPELNAVQSEINSIFAEVESMMLTNQAYFERIKSILPRLDLHSEEYAVTQEIYNRMIQEGALLSTAQKNEIIEIKKQLAELSTNFSNNMLVFTNDIAMLRSKNEKIVIETVKLRHELAKRLGYPSYAHLTLANRMVGSPERLRQFYDGLIPHIQRLKREEDEALRAFKNENPYLNDTQAAAAMKKTLFNFDDASVSEYFEVNHTLEKTLQFIGDLFEVNIQHLDGVQSFLPEIKVYQIIDRSTGELLSEMHVDLYARSSKWKGAWKETLRPAGLGPSGREHSIMGIFLNLPSPSENHPTLMKVSQVKTLLHELGHALHDALSNLKYKTLAGTSVKFDFVEFPSQLMEHWLITPEYLSKVAKHYRTKASFPNEWVSQIQQERSYRIGNSTLGQIRLGVVDFGWHAATDLHFDENCDFVCRFEQESLMSFSIPSNHSLAESSTFRHIFGGEYASGYYSYLWSDVINQDAFSYWYEDPSQIHEKAMHLRSEILSQGGRRDPNALYRAWRGRDYSPDAFFQRIKVLPTFSFEKLPKLLPPPNEAHP